MSKIVVNTNVTLDGVMQSPASADEDPRGGFEHGGWAIPYFDQVMAEQAGQGIAQGGAFLFGRRTFEHFASVWPHQPDDDMSRAEVLRLARRTEEATSTLRDAVELHRRKGNVVDEARAEALLEELGA